MNEKLERLALILKTRKMQASTPYIVLLTSSISLTPAMMRQICGSESWYDFRQYIQSMGPNDRINVINYYLDPQQTIDGYRALARLINKDYFSTILTANADSLLESALEEEGAPSSAIQKLILGKETDVYINDALSNPTNRVRIIKLHGSLNDGFLPPAYPAFFDPPDNIRESVMRYLNQDLIIAGQLAFEDGIIRALNRSVRSSIYYALPQKPSVYDEVVKTIEARGHKLPSQFIISGHCGSFNTFFTRLDSLLIN